MEVTWLGGAASPGRAASRSLREARSATATCTHHVSSVLQEVYAHLRARLLDVHPSVPASWLCTPVKRRGFISRQRGWQTQQSLPCPPPPAPRAPHHQSDCLAGWVPPPPTGLSREPPWGRGEKKAKSEGAQNSHLLGGKGQGLHPEDRDQGQRQAPYVAAAGPNPGAAGRRPRCTQ